LSRDQFRDLVGENADVREHFRTLVASREALA
jgi:hypothetical protein